MLMFRREIPPTRYFDLGLARCGSSYKLGQGTAILLLPNSTLLSPSPSASHIQFNLKSSTRPPRPSAPCHRRPSGAPMILIRPHNGFLLLRSTPPCRALTAPYCPLCNIPLLICVRADLRSSSRPAVMSSPRRNSTPTATTAEAPPSPASTAWCISTPPTTDHTRYARSLAEYSPVHARRSLPSCVLAPSEFVLPTWPPRADWTAAP
jgi:hypothetical protein